MEEIVTQDLVKDYGHGRGVFGISFTINSGEVFGFLGPNGAGKSTTIRHLMGFSKPDSGRAMIKGIESFGHYCEFMESVGYLPGEIALPAGLTGYEFIEMMKSLKHVKNDEWLKYLLDKFECDPQGDTKRMSLGIKRKLAIVTAFMNDPDILVLDEPTSGLDLQMQLRFIDFIKSEKKRGKTILLSSHMFGEVDATCDRIAIIKDGYIVSEFHANDLKHKSDKVYRVFFANVEDKTAYVNSINDTKPYKVLETLDTVVTVYVNDKDVNCLIGDLSNYKVIKFEHVKESLEDYFMSYYKEDKQFGAKL